MRVTHPDPFAARWRARWIWSEAPAIEAQTATRPVLADPLDKVALFRSEVELVRVPERVPARLWVDGRYVLRVNGVEVARGPVRSDPRAARYDVVDLAPHLRSGANVIAITARHFGQATSWWMPVPPTYSLGAGSLVLSILAGAYMAAAAAVSGLLAHAFDVPYQPVFAALGFGVPAGGLRGNSDRQCQCPFRQGASSVHREPLCAKVASEARTGTAEGNES